MIVVPETVESAFNELSLGKARGGMRTSEGVYESLVKKGEEDAKNHYGNKVLNA